MANKEKPNNPAKQLKQDYLVEQLMPDPGNPQSTIQLTGWLGKGTEVGLWRLYLTPQLDEYVEFSEDTVVLTQPVQKEQSALGGTTVWLKAGTALPHTQILKRQVQADFLSGGITSGFLAGSTSSLPAASFRPAAVVGNTRGYVCSVNPHIPVCQPRTYACPIPSDDAPCTGALCPSGAFVCGYSAGCTQHQECSVGC
jgi:hypothetical protein